MKNELSNQEIDVVLSDYLGIKKGTLIIRGSNKDGSVVATPFSPTTNDADAINAINRFGLMTQVSVQTQVKTLRMSDQSFFQSWTCTLIDTIKLTTTSKFSEKFSMAVSLALLEYVEKNASHHV